MHAAQPTYLQAETEIISNIVDDIVDNVKSGVGQAAFEQQDNNGTPACVTACLRARLTPRWHQTRPA